MKKLLFTLILLPILCVSQTWQSVPGLFDNVTGVRFDDVYFIDDNLGWALNGYYAGAYKTTDGGLSWELKFHENEIPGDYYFRNIEFLDANIGFIGALGADFFKTVDGGETWSIVSNIPTATQAICGIHALTGTTTVYACGAYFTPAYIIKSIDSGANWQYIDMSSYATALVEVKFVNENLGYAAGSDANGAIVLKTTNGGTTWTSIFNSTIAGEYIWKLQFIENDTDVIFGSLYSTGINEGKLIKSFDAGVTWTSLTAPETGVQALGFVSQTKGWMGGHNTGFFETVDGGQNWTDLNLGGNLNRIFVLPNNLAYASGSTIYKYTTEVLETNDIREFRKPLNIKIVSNPVNKELELSINFKSTDHLLIELYDIKGRKIKQLTRDIINVKGDYNYTFNVSDLSSGTYILDFHSDSGRSSEKFIKL